MNFLENGLNPLLQDPCKDFVQFGRDLLFVTTSKSQKYCGTLSRPAVVDNFREFLKEYRL